MLSERGYNTMALGNAVGTFDTDATGVCVARVSGPERAASACPRAMANRRLPPYVTTTDAPVADEPTTEPSRSPTVSSRAWTPLEEASAAVGWRRALTRESAAAVVTPRRVRVLLCTREAL